MTTDYTLRVKMQQLDVKKKVLQLHKHLGLLFILFEKMSVITYSKQI